MKNTLIRSFLAFVIAFGVASASAQVQTKVMKPEAVFAPKGFDANDNAQLVISGQFTGYCMKMGATHHQVNQDLNQIWIENHVIMSGSCPDLDMFIPYSKTIDLGPLAPGNYSVYVRNEQGDLEKMADLPINEVIATGNTGSSDARLYAPVTEIHFNGNTMDPDPVLTLSGVFTNSCFELDLVQVNYRSDNLVDVLPLVKVGKVNCHQEYKKFSKKVTLKGFPTTDTLIHVRSMNGQSINKIITNLDRI
jgi:hypothetical protein